MTSIIKTIVQNEVGRYILDPAELTKLPISQVLDLDASIVEQIQLEALKRRFEYFRPRIQALEKLANEQGIHEIETLDDAGPLLFQHSVYKSYPLFLIEKKRFDKLTEWLQKLTTHDLSTVNTKGVKTIDGWLQAIEDATDIEIVHSSGTTGKLSFLPRSASEMAAYTDGFYLLLEGMTGNNYRKVHMPVFFPGYRDGRQLQQRVIGKFGPEIAGSNEEFHTAFDGFMSADFMSLAGRVKAAKAKGELGKLQLIKALAHNKGELIKMKRQAPKMMEAFIKELVTEYAGKTVLFMGVWSVIIETALAGLEQGASNLFGHSTGIVTGGGMKNYQPPEGWYEKCLEFYGVPFIRDSYGMTEMTGGGCIPCDHNHYHLPPWLIPYLLDPETGKVQPRNETKTGRFAFYDLLTESYWGGFITGDEVTIHWDNDPCGCGYKGVWFDKGIQRYSEKQGGDDKITCAGVQEANEALLDFLLEED
ncbi:MAG: hypothetical protein ACFFE8_07540 [Candidatus Heimdallarchaeota archaeon]